MKPRNLEANPRLRLFTNPKVIALLFRLKLIDLQGYLPPLTGGVVDEQFSLLHQINDLLRGRLLEGVTPDEARQGFAAGMKTFRAMGGLYEKVYQIRDMDIPGPAGRIPARLYLPDANKNHPLIVYFHGGGWVLGSKDTCDNMARFFCRHSCCAILSVDYRLAPEHPFPAGLEDCLAAVRWAASHAGELGCDPQRIMAGGDSAGASLCAVVAQNLRSSDVHLTGQILVCPPTNLASLDTDSYNEFGDGTYGLPKMDMEWFIDCYAPNPADRLDPRVSPLLADDLSGLPPALVVTAEFDVLRDEGEAYAARLEEAGVPVTLVRGPGLVHCFPGSAGLIRRATQYFDQIASEVRDMVRCKSSEDAQNGK